MSYLKERLKKLNITDKLNTYKAVGENGVNTMNFKFFTETEKGVLCELRSNKYNINPIAVKYGGGGHAKASGATVADKETAMAMLRDLDAMMGE